MRVGDNHWFDDRCARAFWDQRQALPYRELLRDTAAWLDPRPGEHWLDLGCGCGQLTAQLWQRSGGGLARVVAVDCAAASAVLKGGGGRGQDHNGTRTIRRSEIVGGLRRSGRGFSAAKP
jgi:ubiquinone/menaquinone biosynthesis C-methylase UbiE